MMAAGCRKMTERPCLIILIMIWHLPMHWPLCHNNSWIVGLNSTFGNTLMILSMVSSCSSVSFSTLTFSELSTTLERKGWQDECRWNSSSLLKKRRVVNKLSYYIVKMKFDYLKMTARFCIICSICGFLSSGTGSSILSLNSLFLNTTLAAWHVVVRPPNPWWSKLW